MAPFHAAISTWSLNGIADSEAAHCRISQGSFPLWNLSSMSVRTPPLFVKRQEWMKGNLKVKTMGAFLPSEANSSYTEPAEAQVGEKMSSAIWKLRQWRLDIRNLEISSCGNKWLNRCLHHLLAIAMRPEMVKQEKLCDNQGHITCSSRARQMKYKVHQHSCVQVRNISVGDISVEEDVTQLWNGYWVGPGYEDGWGYVEAIVIPGG